MKIKSRKVLNWAVQITIAGSLPDSYYEITVKIVFIKEKLKKVLKRNRLSTHQIQVQV
jgi:hypothetical protein